MPSRAGQCLTAYNLWSSWEEKNYMWGRLVNYRGSRYTRAAKRALWVSQRSHEKSLALWSSFRVLLNLANWDLLPLGSEILSAGDRRLCILQVYICEQYLEMTYRAPLTCHDEANTGTLRWGPHSLFVLLPDAGCGMPFSRASCEETWFLTVFGYDSDPVGGFSIKFGTEEVLQRMPKIELYFYKPLFMESSLYDPPWLQQARMWQLV